MRKNYAISLFVFTILIVSLVISRKVTAIEHFETKESQPLNPNYFFVSLGVAAFLTMFCTIGYITYSSAS